jgi:hypothetical protein
MHTYIKDAIIEGGTKAATEIYKSLVLVGAIQPDERIAIQLASIIVKQVMLEINMVEHQHNKG